MTALPEARISVEDYLRGEESSAVKHEYMSGRVHAMAGATETHNLIAGNLHAALHAHLRNSSCRVYIADFKIHLQINRDDLFYYPDVMVGCLREGVEKYHLRYPKLVIEVLSPSTEAIDRREKFLNYRTIPTLDEYVTIAQEKREVTLHRRSDDWAGIILTEMSDALELRSIKINIPLTQIYEGLPSL